MQVLSRCPLRIASIMWLPSVGTFALTVVCKATFKLEQGVSWLAEQQEPPVESDVYWDDDEEKSLALATDLVPARSPEVVVVGHAHSAGGSAVTALVARVSFAQVDKSLDVVGDQFLAADGALSSPTPFTKMPLRWERATGGADTSNPVGVRMGPTANRDAWGRIALPNFRARGTKAIRTRDILEPVGLGPIAPTWPHRVARLGAHAPTWSVDTWSARALPDNLDMAYFNAAPGDQLAGSLTGLEALVLEHLHPTHAFLQTRLAAVSPRAIVDWGDGRTNELPMIRDALTIDADRGLALLTFRCRVTLDRPDRAGAITVVLDEAVATPRLTTSSWSEPDEETFSDSGDEVTHDEPVTNRTVKPAARRPTLPSGFPTAPGAELPFVRPSSAPQAIAEAPPLAGLPFLPPIQQAGPDAAPKPTTSVPPRTFGEIAANNHYVPPANWSSLERLSTAEIPVQAALPPPPKNLGAIPTAAEPEQPPPGSEEVGPPEPPPLPFETHPLERCARIAASVARTRDKTAEILESHELEEWQWERLLDHWLTAIRREQARGKTALLRAFDEAYVAQLEEERGEIRVEDYAKIVVGGERGQAAEVLEELDLPEGALLRIQRLWIAKTGKDPELRKTVNVAVAAASDA